MRFFRRGFWQKLVIHLALLLEFGFIFFFAYALFSEFLSSELALYFTIFLWAISFLFGLMIISSNSEDSYKLAWLFLVGMVPFFGSLIYLLFAHKRRTKAQNRYFRRYFEILRNGKQKEEDKLALEKNNLVAYRIANYICNCSSGVIYRNSRVKYFPLGDLMYPAMLEELRKAKHYIFIEYFIITPGKMWDSILEILKEKAKAGVDVRVFWDDVGNTSSTPVLYEKKLAKFGIKAHVYEKIKPFIDARYNNRDHRKIMVIDGHTAFTGGVNLADEYINIKNRFGVWKDNAIMVKGEAVTGYTLLFLATWNTKFAPAPLDYSYYDASRFIDEIGGFPPNDDLFVLPYGDLPYDDFSSGEGSYNEIINKATKYVYMTSPYFIPTGSLLASLERAALSGVDVRLLTPGIPDKKLVYQLTRRNYGRLLKAGVKVYEFQEGFIHSKTFIQDDSLAAIGTINLDFRSLCLHAENATLLVGKKIVGEMKEDFLETMGRSREISLEEWKRWKNKHYVLWGILALTAPFM